MSQSNNKGTGSMSELFSTPISTTKVRGTVYAYKYRNGCINIQGQKYFGYSMAGAIKIWRKENSIK